MYQPSAESRAGKLIVWTLDTMELIASVIIWVPRVAIKGGMRRAGDQDTIQRTEQAAGCQDDQKPGPERRPHLLQATPADHGRAHGDGADGKVDAAGDDGEGDADGEEADVVGRVQDIDQRFEGQEVSAEECEESVDGEQGDQCEDALD